MKIRPCCVSLLSLVFFLAPLGCQASPLWFPSRRQSPTAVPSPRRLVAPIEKSSPEIALRSNPLASLEADAFREINQYRAQNGLAPLAIDPVLTQQARAHSRDMASRRRLSHDGFDDRLQAITHALPLRSMAENVANNYGYANPAQVAVKGWIKSPGHHSNIVGKYNRTGVGVAVSPDGNYFFTQLFVESR